MIDRVHAVATEVRGRCRRCKRALKLEPWAQLGIGRICAAKSGYEGPLFEQGDNMRAAFSIVSVDDKTVTIRDSALTHHTMSVTNDAEAVVKHLNRSYPGRRVMYYDTDGQLDELLHDNGKFIGFKPGPRDA